MDCLEHNCIDTHINIGSIVVKTTSWGPAILIRVHWYGFCFHFQLPVFLLPISQSMCAANCFLIFQKIFDSHYKQTSRSFTNWSPEPPVFLLYSMVFELACNGLYVDLLVRRTFFNLNQTSRSMNFIHFDLWKKQGIHFDRQLRSITYHFATSFKCNLGIDIDFYACKSKIEINNNVRPIFLCKIIIAINRKKPFSIFCVLRTNDNNNLFDCQSLIAQ